MATFTGTLRIRTGLHANLPASAALGELLYETDTGNVYVGNGVGFALTGPIGAGGGGGGPTGPAGGDLAGTYPSPTVRQSAGPFALGGVVAAAIAANQNDWAPAGLGAGSVVRANVTGNVIVTGLSSAGAVDGELKLLLNVGTGALGLTHQDGASLAANRFALPFGKGQVVRAGESILLRYSITTSRWETVGTGIDIDEGSIALSNVTTNNVTSAFHGFAPVSPADATKFLNGAPTPAYAQVKDSDLSLSNITTNDVGISQHGFAPAAPNDTTKFLRGDATWAAPASATADVQVFTTTGANTWTKPAGKTYGMAMLQAGGAGGGSGRVGAGGTGRFGGGGGSAGAYVEGFFLLSAAGATETLTVGAGGAGGAAAGAAAMDGNSGANGGDTIFNLGGAAYLTAKGGFFGVGGTATAGTAGPVVGGQFSGGAGGPGSAGAGGSDAAPASTALAGKGAGGGGGGSGLSSANTTGTAGNGGASSFGAGGAGAILGNAGTAGRQAAGNVYLGGSGGGGGHTNNVGSNGAGGNGGLYGGGGGGGAAAPSTQLSGKGGDGAKGFGLVVCW